MLNEGRILADRYEITGKIGAGGMSDVYKAKDHKLNRFVAVKVLKSEFSENKTFVSKFRVEAQSAAILMHPNIVNVYDVGDEDGLYYIVMELVEGITLKKYIEKKLRLSVKETISIAIQVSMGIESAHNNHIIHRDIKPQNIIISKEGKVKVTDFGIARAATSNTITSNAMGSVHYTSPEQARGGYSDAKSDIYSLGVTMYEMLTGRVPFDGETTVSIAIQHIQDELPSPREYVDDIPVSVEQIIFKCCQKNAARRYQSMAELIVDLKKSLITPDEDFVQINDLESQGKTQMVTERDLKTIREETGSIKLGNYGEEEFLRKTPYPKKRKNAVREYSYEPEYSTVGAKKYDNYEQDYEENEYDPEEYYEDSEYESGYDADERYEEPEDEYEKGSYSRERSSRRGKSNSVKKKNSSSKKSKAKHKPAAPVNTKKKQPKAAEKPQRNDRNRYKEPEPIDDEIDPKMERLMSVLGVIAALIIAAIAIFIVGKMIGVFKTMPGSEQGTSENSTIESVTTLTMPAVTGKNYEVAKEQLQGLGLEVSAEYVPSDTVEAGQVISQSVEPEAQVKTGDEIVLSVSAGKDGVKIPDVTGKSEAEARVLIEAEGFEFVADECASDEVEKGNVISQTPSAGESVEKGSKVTVIISTGPTTVPTTVPNVVGDAFELAKVTLEAAKLEVEKVTEEYSDTVAEGLVIEQSLMAGTTVNEGSSVSIVVSKGPENVLKYYKINYTVNAPSTYAGGVATVSLAQADTGTVLFQTSTTSFPVEINLTNITGSDDAVITTTYTIENTYITENEDGSVNSKVSTEEKKDITKVKLTLQE